MQPAIMVGSPIELFVCLSVPAFILAVFSACVVYFFTERPRTAWASVPLFMFGWMILMCAGIVFSERADDAEAMREWEASREAARKAAPPEEH